MAAIHSTARQGAVSVTDKAGRWRVGVTVNGQDADGFLASMRTDEIESLLDDLMTVVTQREQLRDQVSHLLPVVLRQEQEIDALYVMLAGQALVNEELRGRIAWYRRLLHEEGHGAIGKKRATLLADHRLNGES